MKANPENDRKRRSLLVIKQSRDRGGAGEGSMGLSLLLQWPGLGRAGYVTQGPAPGAPGSRAAKTRLLVLRAWVTRLLRGSWLRSPSPRDAETRLEVPALMGQPGSGEGSKPGRPAHGPGASHGPAGWAVTPEGRASGPRTRSLPLGGAAPEDCRTEETLSDKSPD